MRPSGLLFAFPNLVVVTSAHFVLQLPKSLGYNDVLEAQPLCGSFDVASRNTVTDWPIGGSAVSVLSTHPKATWQIRAALANDTGTWTDLIPSIAGAGLGDFCLPAVPGHAEWVGLDAVLQVTQSAADGTLYQCAAIKFVLGDAAIIPSSCKNSTGPTASFTSVIPATASASVSTSTSMSMSTSRSMATGPPIPDTPCILGLFPILLLGIL
ncbi:hypothetical protein LTR66_007591 [Elasticomyces elasticus]|nr:hypothetical protein LTR66_007591 [Elasticomyces elasticus]